VPGYVLSAESKDDLREIRDYLARQGGRRRARYVLEEIAAGFRLLVAHPEAGHSRTIPPPAIVRLLHGRRDVAAIISRETE
jgi:plasmid stabilization system protein ParE